jgi:hypothetical protein
VIAALADVWNSLGTFQAQIVAFVLTTIGGIIAYLLRPKVKLIWGRANNSFHVLRPTEQQIVNVYCEKLYVQNLGSKPAEKVEVVLSGAPSEFTIYPPRTYEKKLIENGQLSIAVPYIAPHELVIIDTIHVNNRTAEIVSVHCPEALGFRVEFWVLRKFRPRFYFILSLLTGLGTFYSVQILIRALAYLFLDRAP